MNNEQTIHIVPPRRVELGLVTLLFVLVAFVAVAIISGLQNLGRPSVPATDTITVSGQGQVSLSPDIAHVTFSVQNTSKTVADAQSATTKQANDAIAYVKSQNIADKDIKTESYNVSPQYSYPVCPPGTLCPNYGSGTITGYQVSETIQVTVRNLDEVGTLLGGLGKLQVQNISGPDFALDNPNAGSDAARAAAIDDAKAEAQTLAKQLGVSLGKIVSFSESSGGYPYPVAYGVAAQAKDMASTPTVPTGQNQYSASVSITYEIR